MFCLTKGSAQTQAIKEMHITEQLLYASIKVEAINENNKAYSGTGFFFKFFDDKKNEIPLIITNRHVVDSAKIIRLYFKKGKNGNPDLAPTYIVDIANDSTTIISHPNKNVDLVSYSDCFY